MATIKYKNGDSWSTITIGTSNLTWQQIYPVGAVYISYSSSAPGTLFGGTWSSITGKFPYFNAGTGTGGSNTHTLTTAQMPSHNHQLSNWGRTVNEVSSPQYGLVASGGGFGGRCIVSGLSGSDKYTNSGSTGGGESHNNMPAYQTFYAWRRTA